MDQITLSYMDNSLTNATEWKSVLKNMYVTVGRVRAMVSAVDGVRLMTHRPVSLKPIIYCMLI